MSAATTDSRSLADLAPHVRAMAEQLLADATEAGIPLAVTCTRRSAAEQTARYDQGRVTPGPIVTRAPAGYSYHEFGLALDVVPTELLSLKNWGDTPEHRVRANELWARVGAIGKALGFRWGGDFPTLVDRPHFEWSGGLSLAQLRGGRSPVTKPNETAA